MTKRASNLISKDDIIPFTTVIIMMNTTHSTSIQALLTFKGLNPLHLRTGYNLIGCGMWMPNDGQNPYLSILVGLEKKRK